MRRAKIVCTLGPAVSTPEKIRQLVEAGMDVARLNMSHGDHEEHQLRYDMVRAASDASGHGVGIIADLQGPKIRLETFAEGKVKLAKGSEFVITTRDVAGDATICGTTYKGLPGDVSEGDPILVDDGKLRLRVIKVDDTDVTTRVEVAGKVSDHKGLNLPGVAVSVPALSEKDKDDLRWALRTSVDFIALSFVRSGADADDVRAIMREEGVVLPIIAKIEKPQAIDNLDEIIKAFDAFMVARGDLGVECPARGRAVPAEACDRPGPAQRQAGDRGHPDARVDDHQPAAHARRGLRRRERRPRRRRRGDAVGRDQRG